MLQDSLPPGRGSGKAGALDSFPHLGSTLSALSTLGLSGRVKFSTRHSAAAAHTMLLCRSVVQFQYGEDGIDVMQVGFLRKFGFLSQNVARFAQQLDVGRVQQASAAARTAELEAAARQQTRWVTEPVLLCLAVPGSRQQEE